MKLGRQRREMLTPLVFGSCAVPRDLAYILVSMKEEVKPVTRTYSRPSIHIG